MGCNSTREIIESKILTLKLKRIDIQEERQNKIKDLEKITGKKQNRKKIEDYVCSSSSSSEEDEKSSTNFGYENKKKKHKNKKHHKNTHHRTINSKTTRDFSDIDDYYNENSNKNIYNMTDVNYKKTKHKKFKSEIKKNFIY